MKRMIDPLLIAQIAAAAALNAKDIADIQDLLDGKDFFDGSTKIEQIGGDKGIKAANIPTDAGIYKSDGGGFLIVTKTSATALHCLAFYDDNIYFEERTTTTATNFVFSSSNLYPARDTTPTQDSANLITSGGVYNFVKPIYYHPIAIVSETTDNTNVSRLQLVILDNQSTAYTKTTLIAKLHDLMDNGALININGYFFDNANVLNNGYMIQKVSGDYRVYGNSTSDRNYISLTRVLNESELSSVITDGVNRIN